jgi:hypothetical protein
MADYSPCSERLHGKTSERFNWADVEVALFALVFDISKRPYQGPGRLLVSGQVSGFVAVRFRLSVLLSAGSVFGVDCVYQFFGWRLFSLPFSVFRLAANIHTDAIANRIRN